MEDMSSIPSLFRGAVMTTDNVDPPRGIRCPRCQCRDLRTTHTRPLPGGLIRRYKRCRHCSQRLTTVEARPSPGHR
jgi:DNA-directed RNA polymerase subunit RPC12/RpoP